jgi:DNA-binding NarL/FixJ family response regulator
MGHRIRVLITDDSAPARDGLRVLLANWPEVEIVGEATDGQSALRLVAEQQPDVVLMDMRMPELDGVQATRLIKQSWPAIKVIVLTIYAAGQTPALAAGADAFLLKGGDPAQLLTTLRMVVQPIAHDQV